MSGRTPAYPLARLKGPAQAPRALRIAHPGAAPGQHRVRPPENDETGPWSATTRGRLEQHDARLVNQLLNLPLLNDVTV